MAYQYDLAGRRTRQTWPDSFYVTQDWNLSNQMTAIKHAGTTQIIGYAYDNLGRRTGITRGNGVSTTYGYDAISRLTSLTHDVGGTAADVAFAYSYNPAGQIVTRVANNDAYSHAFGSTATQTSVIDGLNRLATLNTVNLGYDDNGNITNDTAKTYGYDDLSRLTGVNSGASTLNYDALGRLYEYDGTGGGRFLYDGVEIAGFGNVGSTTIGTRFVRGPWPDEIVANFTSSGSTPAQYWAYDERGSLINLSNGSTGLSTRINTYDEYGQPASTNQGRLQYTGQLWLPDFGLYHYKARAYHPGIGRFMQTDPIGYAAGANLYGYVGGDPVNLVDPWGLNEREISREECRRLRGRIVPRSTYAPGTEGYDFCIVDGQPTPHPVGSGDPTAVEGTGGNSASGVEPPSVADCAAAVFSNPAFYLDALSLGASFVPAGRGMVTVGAGIFASNAGVASMTFGLAGEDFVAASIGFTGHYAGLAQAFSHGGVDLLRNLPVSGQLFAAFALGYTIYRSLEEGGCF